MLKGRKIWILIFGLFLLDQLTKVLFYDYKIGQELWILEPVFNTGISRGLKLNAWIILIVSALGLGLFVYLWRKKYISSLVFVLMLAWTVWNLSDRLILWGVRDFVSLGSFPVFNVADCFLTVAVMILLRNEFFPCNWNKKPYLQGE